MKILVAYASTEGQTKKIARTIADRIAGLGHEATLFDMGGLKGDLRLRDFDRYILAASVHEKRHQEAAELFAAANRDAFGDRPVMFVSVSLAAAFPEARAEAQGYADAFFESIGWKPGRTVLVAGAVRHGEYGFYKEQILEHVVLKDRDLENLHADHEFTDWEALAAEIADFVEAE